MQSHSRNLLNSTRDERSQDHAHDHASLAAKASTRSRWSAPVALPKLIGSKRPAHMNKQEILDARALAHRARLICGRAGSVGKLDRLPATAWKRPPTAPQAARSRVRVDLWERQQPRSSYSLIFLIELWRYIAWYSATEVRDRTDRSLRCLLPPRSALHMQVGGNRQTRSGVVLRAPSIVFKSVRWAKGCVGVGLTRHYYWARADNGTRSDEPTRDRSI